MEPAAMPMSGSTPSTRVMPNGNRFCRAMMSTSRQSITTRVLPPWRSTLRLDWNPTEVKKASRNTSLSVPSKVISTPLAR